MSSHGDTGSQEVKLSYVSQLFLVQSDTNLVNCSFKSCRVDTQNNFQLSDQSFSFCWSHCWPHRWHEFILRLWSTLTGQYFKLLWWITSDRDISQRTNRVDVHVARSVVMTVSSVTLLCLGLCLFLVGPCQCGCRETGLCCTGRDPSCISKGWRSDRSYGTCYCDQACVHTLDCCHDYETACPGGSVLTTKLVFIKYYNNLVT